jgi:hypothetical protein
VNQIISRPGWRGSLGIQGEDLFALQHPEVEKLLPNLLGIFAACQRLRLQGDREDLEDAYQHVYVSRGGCSWCQYHLNMVRECLEEEAAPPPMSH